MTNLSRKQFLMMSAVGAGTIMLPSALNAAPKSKKSDSDRKIRLGFIGVGKQSLYLLSGFIGFTDDVQVVAGCDVYDIKRNRFEKRVRDFYAEKGIKCDLVMYENYKDLITRDDIDAVVIATPDHWHAKIAIEACKNKKDVYLEKPMTFTIKEGQDLCKAVRQNNRILQVGSQQRSDSEFIHAIGQVQEGNLGKIYKIEAYVGDGPKDYDLEAQPVPAGLNWDMWLGPLYQNFHYNDYLNQAFQENPYKEEDYGGWRWFKGMGGGFTTDWGAHMFDIGQWAIGKDRSGPVEIIPPGHKGYKHLTFVYDNGIIMSQEPYNKGERGVKFYGENGWIIVSRGKFEASDKKFYPSSTKREEGPYETKIPHQRAFIDSIRTRIDPNVPVEIGHSSCTVCNLGNIAIELDRPIKWNPIVQKFVDDPQASKMLSYEYRKGYEQL